MEGITKNEILPLFSGFYQKKSSKPEYITYKPLIWEIKYLFLPQLTV